MAENDMTIREVADLLQVTERTIRNYVIEGFLGYHKVQGKRGKMFDPMEVQQLREELETSGQRTLVSRKEIRQALSRLTRLESQMQVVLRMLDAKNEPLGLNPEQAAALYETAYRDLGKGKWDLDEINAWVDIFLRLTEEDFNEMTTQDSKPWRIILKLCIAMTALVVKHREYETSLERQQTHKLLAEGRRRLRVAALCFTELYGELDINIRRLALSDSPGSLRDSMADRLKRKSVDK